MNLLSKIFSKNPIQTGTNNPVLRRQAEKVAKITPAVLRLIERMSVIIKENRYQVPGFVNVGLAAPQIGYSLRIIVFIMWPKRNLVALINPEITWFSKNKIIMEESCLSVPKMLIPVERSTRITASGLSPQGNQIEIKAKGFLARLIQHEVDHLNGILIVDRQTK